MTIEARDLENAGFNGLAQSGLYALPLFLRQNFLKNINALDKIEEPEEVREHNSAFLANANTAAARRMRQYLMRSGNGSISAVLAGTDGAAIDANNGSNTVRWWALTSTLRNAMATAAAPVTFTQVIDFARTNESKIMQLIDDLQDRYDEFMAERTAKHEETRDAEVYIDQIESRLAEAEETMRQTTLSIEEAKRNMTTIGQDFTVIENSAIKIVRSHDSFLSMRSSWQAPEAEAPEIYIIAGIAAEDGAVIYDRLTMGDGGTLIIDRVNENDVPMLRKSEDVQYSDTIERAYWNPDAADTPFLRNEYGANGQQLGPIGAISSAMINEYLETSGRKARDIAPDTHTFEQSWARFNGIIDEHYAAHHHKWTARDVCHETEQDLARAIEMLDMKRAELQYLETMTSECCNDLKKLHIELVQTQNLITQAEKYQLQMQAGLYASPQELLNNMPAALRQAMIDSHIEGHHQDAPAPGLSGKWASINNLKGANDAGGHCNTGIAGGPKFQPDGWLPEGPAPS